MSWLSCVDRLRGAPLALLKTLRTFYTFIISLIRYTKDANVTLTSQIVNKKPIKQYKKYHLIIHFALLYTSHI